MTEKHGKPIAVKQVEKWYQSRQGPIHALAEPSRDIKEGEFVSIVGPSGCGKSTLLMMVAGLVSPSSGAIAVDGHAVVSPYTDLGMMFQRPVLLDWRNVLDNVLVQLDLRSIPRRDFVERAK